MLLNVSGNPTLGPTNLPAKLPPALKALSAASAGLQGPLPADALPPALWFLDLSGNQLSGPVPEGGLQGDVLEAVSFAGWGVLGGDADRGRPYAWSAHAHAPHMWP